MSSFPDIWNFGVADGLFLPSWTGLNLSALILHEGPWGAVAANYDAFEYGNRDIFSVAVLSANVRTETIASTLDLIFPGVPRFSIFDQDPAGVALRARTLDIAKPITIPGAGHGVDYRDLCPEVRFERLVNIIVRELKQIESRP
ncbi:MAG: hypothetical protein WCJ18_06580 [Planctomycetota bacterium]